MQQLPEPLSLNRRFLRSLLWWFDWLCPSSLTGARVAAIPSVFEGGNALEPVLPTLTQRVAGRELPAALQILAIKNWIALQAMKNPRRIARFGGGGAHLIPLTASASTSRHSLETLSSCMNVVSGDIRTEKALHLHPLTEQGGAL